MKQYFHYCSKGLKSDVLFANPTEFIAGMNRVAICFLLGITGGRKVLVISICLMDNHVHFILFGTRADCEAFVATYKKLTGMWVQKHRGERLHEEIEFGGFPIRDKDDLKEKIAYVLRNPVAAGMETTVYGYNWSTGMLMFNQCELLLQNATPAHAFGVREKRLITNSKNTIPDNWLIFKNGMIWPGSYTEATVAMRQFNSLSDYMYMINDRRIDKKVNEEMLKDSLSIPDGELRDHASVLARDLFGKDRISMCSPEERLSVCRILKKEYRSGAKQLARVVGLPKEKLEAMV